MVCWPSACDIWDERARRRARAVDAAMDGRREVGERVVEEGRCNPERAILICNPPLRGGEKDIGREDADDGKEVRRGGAVLCGGEGWEDERRRSDV